MQRFAEVLDNSKFDDVDHRAVLYSLRKNANSSNFDFFDFFKSLIEQDGEYRGVADYLYRINNDILNYLSDAESDEYSAFMFNGVDSSLSGHLIDENSVIKSVDAFLRGRGAVLIRDYFEFVIGRNHGVLKLSVTEYNFLIEILKKFLRNQNVVMRIYDESGVKELLYDLSSRVRGRVNAGLGKLGFMLSLSEKDELKDVLCSKFTELYGKDSSSYVFLSAISDSELKLKKLYGYIFDDGLEDFVIYFNRYRSVWTFEGEVDDRGNVVKVEF